MMTNLDSNLRALIFNCFENLGTIKSENYKDFIKNLIMKRIKKSYQNLV